MTEQKPMTMDPGTSRSESLAARLREIPDSELDLILSGSAGFGDSLDSGFDNGFDNAFDNS